MPEIQKKLLIIDDNVDMCSTLEDIFSAEGYKVQIADNGNRAIELVKSSNFDIVLTDIIMEKLSGIETIKKIKDIQKDVLLYAMTAYHRDSRVNEALQAGAIKVFEKPFEAFDVITEFKKATKKKE